MLRGNKFKAPPPSNVKAPKKNTDRFARICIFHYYYGFAFPSSMLFQEPTGKIPISRQANPPLDIRLLGYSPSPYLSHEHITHTLARMNVSEGKSTTVLIVSSPTTIMHIILVYYIIHNMGAGPFKYNDARGTKSDGLTAGTEFIRNSERRRLLPHATCGYVIQ